jgi:hypothetical protein
MNQEAFEVTLSDGTVIFSKLTSNEIPNVPQIAASVRAVADQRAKLRRNAIEHAQRTARRQSLIWKVSVSCAGFMILSLGAWLVVRGRKTNQQPSSKSTLTSRGQPGNR